MKKNINNKESNPLSYLYFKKVNITNINTNLNMLNNRMVNVITSDIDSNAATLNLVGKLLQKSIPNKLLLLTGNDTNDPITGDLNFNGQSTISLTSLPKNDTDAVPAKSLLDILLTNNFLNNKGNSSLNPFTGNLHFNNTQKIIGLANPKNDSDAVNLQTFNSEFSSYLSLSGGALTGPLTIENKQNVPPIINIAEPKNDRDAVPIEYINNLATKTAVFLVKLVGNSKDPLITGDLIFQNATVTGLSNPVDDTDVVNLQTMKSKFSSCMPLSGNALQGSLDMGQNKIIHVSDPKNGLDAINYAYLKQVMSNNSKTKIPLSGTLIDLPITQNLDLGKLFTVLNLPNATEESHPINFFQLKEKKQQYLLLSGSTIKTNLNMSGFKITNLSLAKKNLQLISLQNINNYMNNYLPMTGTSPQNALTNNLIFNKSCLISGIACPSNDQDAINLKTLQLKAMSYLPISGGTLFGSLSSNEILNIKNGTSSSSAVSYKQAEDFLSLKILSVSGNSPLNPINQNLSFNNTSLITGLSNPIEPKDAINLQTLNSKLKSYISLNGNDMKGKINANNQLINNISPNISKNKNQALTLEDVKKHYVSASFNLLASRNNKNIIWSNNLKENKLNFLWSGGSLIKSKNANDFFELSNFSEEKNSIIKFKEAGLFLFSINILNNLNSAKMQLNFSTSKSSNTIANFNIEPFSSINFTTTIYVSKDYLNSYIYITNNSNNNINIFGIDYSIVKLM